MMNRRRFMGKVSLAAGSAAAYSFAPGLPGIAAAQSRAAADSVVETTGGRVRGRVDSGVHVFKGIPYGGSTAGQMRFMPPSKAASWTGFATLRNGPMCPKQRGGQPERGLPCPQRWTRGLMTAACGP